MVKKEKFSNFVTTKSGKKLDKINCKLIDKEYYEKDTECVIINHENKEKWFPKNHPDIGFNMLTNNYDYISNLTNQGLIKFIIDIDEKGQPVYGYSKRRAFINVDVVSHTENIPNSIEKLRQNIAALKLSILKEEDKLKKDTLFSKNYSSFLSTLAKLLYYKEVMNKSYNIGTISALEFEEIIDTVNNFILSNKENEKYYGDFYSTYTLLFSKNETFIEKGYEDKKITFKKLQEDQSLNKLFEIFLQTYSITEGIQNNLKRLKVNESNISKSLKELFEIPFFKGKCIDKNEALRLGFIPSNTSDLFLLKKNLSATELKNMMSISISYGEGVYKNIKMDYNANSNMQAFNKILNDYVSLKDTRKITKDAYNVAKLLKGLSFGLEFETTVGRIREDDLSILGLIPLKDGSVKGFEYTTIPYGINHNELSNNFNKPCTKTLAEDLNTLKEVCDELSFKTIKDHTCSMHLHIGGNRTDKLYLIALYILCYKLQDEMFEMQPLFKIDPPKYAGLNKKYCDKLDHLNLLKNCIFDKSSVLKENYCNNVDNYFNVIFKFLSGGEEIGTKFNRKNHIHPFNKKWDRHARYHWVNFVNCVFSDTGTIEFRLHTATSNFTKVLNWILICSAIVKYAETHTKEIILNKDKNISLDQILLGYSNNFRDKKQTNPFGLFVYNYLKAYVKNRKMTFVDLNRKEDFLGKTDMMNDVSYSFDFNGINSLI